MSNAMALVSLKLKSLTKGKTMKLTRLSISAIKKVAHQIKLDKLQAAREFQLRAVGFPLTADRYLPLVPAPVSSQSQG